MFLTNISRAQHNRTSRWWRNKSRSWRWFTSLAKRNWNFCHVRMYKEHFQKQYRFLFVIRSKSSPIRFLATGMLVVDNFEMLVAFSLLVFKIVTNITEFWIWKQNIKWRFGKISRWPWGSFEFFEILWACKMFCNIHSITRLSNSNCISDPSPHSRDNHPTYQRKRKNKSMWYWLWR